MPTPSTVVVYGLILAGGRSTRFNHVDKGLYKINGKPMVQYVIERLQPQVKGISISCNNNQATYLDIVKHSHCSNNFSASAACFSDSRLGQNKGPLAGIYEFLSDLNDNINLEQHQHHNLVMICSCDMPLIPEDIVTTLHSALNNKQTNAAYVVQGEQKHFLLCLVHAAPALQVLQLMLNKPKQYELRSFSVKNWLTLLAATEVELPHHNEILVNINTQADISRLKLPPSF